MATKKVQKILEKLALDFGATRKLLEKLQQDKVILLRKFDDIINTKIQEVAKDANKSPEFVRSAIPFNDELRRFLINADFVPDINTIFIPRRKDRARFINLGENPDLIDFLHRKPKHTLFHESGHVYSPISKELDKEFYDAFNLENPEEILKQQVRVELKDELSADETAHELLKQFGKKHLIPLYNKLRTQPFKTSTGKFFNGNAQNYIHYFNSIIPPNQQTAEDIKLINQYKKLLGI